MIKPAVPKLDRGYFIFISEIRTVAAGRAARRPKCAPPSEPLAKISPARANAPARGSQRENRVRAPNDPRAFARSCRVFHPTFRKGWAKKSSRDRAGERMHERRDHPVRLTSEPQARAFGIFCQNSIDLWGGRSCHGPRRHRAVRICHVAQPCAGG